MNGTANGIYHPGPLNPVNQHLGRAANTERKIGVPERTPGGTPAPPDDAPPSVKATSAVRRELRLKVKRRIFPTVEYQERVSYFDPKSDYANFRGFFVLFWIGLGIMGITTILRNLKETGNFFSISQWPLFTQDIWDLAVSDLVMAVSTAVDLPLNILYKSGLAGMQWDKGGMILQSTVQAVWLAFWINWPFARQWTWTAQVFFTLHTLAIFMKMHSYAFYCGHLSTTLWRLKQLDMPLGPTTPTAAAVRYPAARTHLVELPQDNSKGGNESEESDNLPPIAQLRADLARELTSPLGNVTYPQNLTVANFIDYLLCPTLCYELEYPRTPKRDYLELFYKSLAVFGCIFLLTITSEEFILPVLDDSAIQLLKASTWIDKSLIFAETVSRLLFPFMVTFLLVFLVIFEYVLGAFAEITGFADRQFYSDWWNSLDWFEFSREWNIPVHNFFRRHVYSASRMASLSRPAATALTFFISAIAHELVMGCITRKFRGYGFVLMMLQMPFVMIQRMPWIRDQKLLNNVMFWICMIIGLSLLCALYVLV